MLAGGSSGRREQEPDFRQILRFPTENIFSRHQHCRASESTVSWCEQNRTGLCEQKRKNALDPLSEIF